MVVKYNLINASYVTLRYGRPALRWWSNEHVQLQNNFPNSNIMTCPDLSFGLVHNELVRVLECIAVKLL